MIVYKDWETLKTKPGFFSAKQAYYWQGWFLFGFIPLYMKRRYMGERL